MSQFQFKKAERKGIFARIALDGPTGAGKTYTALSIAKALANGKRIAVIDTERSSADRYADVFDFDKIDLEVHSPENYINALAAVDPTTYGVIVVDSLSHAWMGTGGALEMVDAAAARSQSGNKFTAWRDVTPWHNKLVSALMGVQAHLIVTMRSKMEYVLEENERGQKVPRKVGMAPVQRDGVEYEFDIVADMNLDNQLVVTKTRASFLNKAIINKPGEDLGRKILEWCGHVEPKISDTDLRELAALGQKNGKTTDDIKALVLEKYGKGVRELTVDELPQVKAMIGG